MNIIIEKHIGRNTYTFTFEGNNLYEVVTKSQNLSFDNVDKCGCCGSDDLILSTHLGKDDKGKEAFEYTDIKCQACRASLTFGQRKDNKDTFYLRRKDGGDLDWRPFNNAPLSRGGDGVGSNNNAPQTQELSSKTAKAPDKPAVNGKSNGKPSKHALEYVTQLVTVKDITALEGLGGRMNIDSKLSETDKEYLRLQYRKKQKSFITQPV